MISTNSQNNHRDPAPVHQVQTPIPTDAATDLIFRLDQCESRSMHGQLPIDWDHAEGHFVYDSSGNSWIDFTSTIFVANIDHSNPRLKSYLKDVIDKSNIACYAYANKIRADYIEELLKFAGPNFEKAFLLSAGTEATEAALKLMRMYGIKNNKRRLGIICLSGNWHGRTMGAQLMSNNIAQREWIGFTDPDIHHIAFPYPWEVTEESSVSFFQDEIAKLESYGIDISKDVCGFMLETFQGWGALFYPKKFVQSIEKLCRKYDSLLCFDEMQSGFGRTGEKFGFEHYGVSPDLIACGKGMGGGLPLSGVLGKAKIMDLPDIGNMSSTHSANPLSCAAGLAVLHEIQERDLINESRKLGLLLRSKLELIKQEHTKYIKTISCKGLIAAVIFHKQKGSISGKLLATSACNYALRKGLLVVHTGRESIKLGPPLSISKEALEEGLSILHESISYAISQ